MSATLLLSWPPPLSMFLILKTVISSFMVVDICRNVLFKREKQPNVDNSLFQSTDFCSHCHPVLHLHSPSLLPLLSAWLRAQPWAHNLTSLFPNVLSVNCHGETYLSYQSPCYVWAAWQVEPVALVKRWAMQCCPCLSSMQLIDRVYSDLLNLPCLEELQVLPQAELHPP